MFNWKIPAITLGIIVLISLVAWLAVNIRWLFWILIILAAIGMLVFQLTVLTPLFDMIPKKLWQTALILVIVLAVFVGAGILLRWLLENAFIYWITSTIAPIIAGGLYIVDTFQSRT